MNSYQETNCVSKQDLSLHEMELRMTERLQIVKNLRLSTTLTDNNTPNIQLPSTRIG